jgi:hypothetical protein
LFTYTTFPASGKRGKISVETLLKTSPLDIVNCAVNIVRGKYFSIIFLKSIFIYLNLKFSFTGRHDDALFEELRRYLELAADHR